ncbi:MAG: RdgB/HAM1 family non-canonical purine NTP pyrophosphatase [Polyangiaceae bacterium]
MSTPPSISQSVTVALSSGNEGKLLELRSLFAELPVEIVSVREVLGEPLTVIEDGETFEENATLKALAGCRATGLICIADDSGLEVDSLGGRPGVRSARYAHDRATDAENNAALLRELEDVEDSRRNARFRCVLAMASPWALDAVETVEGRVEGTIARDPRGSGGFGYDPLFIVDGHDGRAMAELSEDEKNAISHRARAVRAIVPALLRLVSAQYDEAERIVG